MSISNFGAHSAAARTVKTMAAGGTAKEADVLYGIIKTGNTTAGVTITLPTITGDTTYCDLRVLAVGATAKVFASNGFAGASASYDTVTVLRGEFGSFTNDGTYWYSLAATAPASS